MLLCMSKNKQNDASHSARWRKQRNLRSLSPLLYVYHAPLPVWIHLNPFPSAGHDQRHVFFLITWDLRVRFELAVDNGWLGFKKYSKFDILGSWPNATLELRMNLYSKELEPSSSPDIELYKISWFVPRIWKKIFGKKVFSKVCAYSCLGQAQPGDNI